MMIIVIIWKHGQGQAAQKATVPLPNIRCAALIKFNPRRRELCSQGLVARGRKEGREGGRKEGREPRVEFWEVQAYSKGMGGREAMVTRLVGCRCG